jgi:SAM-dependent methyltransferase
MNKNIARKKYDLLHQEKGFAEEVELYQMLGILLKGKKSIDIGCGSGLVEKFSPQTLGVDFSKAALSQAKKSGVKFLVQASADNLPFKDNEFEVALSNGVLEHIEDQEKAISEMTRISKFQIIIAHARLPWGLEYIRKPIIEGLLGLKDQPIEKPLSLRQIENLLLKNNSRVLIRGVWNYIDPRWLWNALPYGLVKIPSHYFVIAIKTKNLKRKFLGESAK